VSRAGPSLSILMAVYNERTTVERAIEDALSAELPVEQRELIVVDDGSTDGTRELLARHTWPAEVKVVLHDSNLGKGTAIRTALGHATGDLAAPLPVQFPITGTYEQLATYVVFASFLFYALSAGAVIRLRRTRPQLARPYRTWGYPVTPLVFIGFALWLVVNTVVEAPRDAAVGAGIVLAGVPAYVFWHRRQGRTQGYGGGGPS